MQLFIARWPRTLLSAATLSLFILVGLIGGANSSAAPSQQTPLPPPSSSPTVQPTKPILFIDPVPDPKQEGVSWYAPTGHTLRGAFLDYWNRYDGLAQFGYPLTEEFYEEVGADHKQYQVQYFERNRFEYHPENKDTQYAVLLGALGLDFRKADLPASPLANAQYFPETGHNLSGAFKQYWETHGGLFVHGFPITEAVQEKSPTDGRVYTVQYFERSRFELHLENAGSAYEVLLGLLGRQLSEKKGYPFGWYPLYGHAPDFSWMAGQLEMQGDYASASIAGCDILRYGHSETVASVQLDGEGWQPFTLPNLPPQPKVYQSDFLVVFGHRVNPGERHAMCHINPAPSYIVEYMQRNPRQ